MPTWPASLPQKPLQRNYQENFGSTLVSTQMDKGPDKRRRRSTARVDTFQVSFIMDTTQVQTFENFVDNDLNGGALSYQWEHPRTGNTRSFRIVPQGQDNIFSLRPLSGKLYEVTMQLEVLPT